MQDVTKTKKAHAHVNTTEKALLCYFLQIYT